MLAGKPLKLGLSLKRMQLRVGKGACPRSSVVPSYTDATSQKTFIAPLPFVSLAKSSG